MLDRFEAMAMFLKVIERGSLSAAGRALGVPVPTLSRRVSDLEAHLGAKLLIRTTRRITLTDAGLAYAQAAARILEHVRDAETQAAGEYVALRGELVLTAPVMFGRLHVLPVVIDFLAAYPAINVRLALSDRNAHLVDDQIDMAVRIGALPSSSLIATTVGTMRTVVCASPALLAHHGTPQAPGDLQAMPTIAVDTFGLTRWQFDQDAITITPRLTVSTAEAAAEAATRSVGVARLLHYQAAGPVAKGDLQIVLTAFEPAPMPVHLVHVDRGAMPLKMRAFLDFAAPRLRRALVQICN